MGPRRRDGRAHEFLHQETTRPLYAHVAVANVRSIRVLEKCGFARVPGDSSSGSDIAEDLFQLDT